MDAAFQYIEGNKERFIEELQEFLRFASVSAQDRHKQDMIDCAAWLKNHLEGIGMEASLVETSGHPIVQGRCAGQSSGKLVIYGHYDVQPEDPLDEWKTPPFDPVIKDGFLYGRGTTDDKGQLFAHVKAIESLLKTQGQLPCEILFLIEGEEECGGSGLEDFVKQQKDKLLKDVIGVVVSDCDMYDEQTPAITYSLRGCAALEVTVNGPSCDVHSGGFGGAIGNPATALANIIAACIGTDGKIKIPGFYDDVRDMQKWEQDNISQLNYDDDNLARQLAIPKVTGESGFPSLARMWHRPTFDINGIYGGYSGQGGKTIIPAKATAKISMRLVPNQQPEKILKQTEEYIRSICPDYVSLEITNRGGAKPVTFETDDALMQAGVEALQAGFGSKSVYIGSGGSIPVVHTFQEELQCPIVLMGLGLEADGAHSPNECFKIDNLINGAKAGAYLMANVK